MTHKKISRKSSLKHVLIFGIFVSIIFWVIETVMEVYVFRIATAGFLQNLLFPDFHEIWMRGLLITAILLLILYIYSMKDRKKKENLLRKAAITDMLTGCLNRRGFFTLAEHQCKVAARSKKTMALLYLDLDYLKIINDELGHEAGDQALIDVATILKSTFRSSDIIARIGGDEFAVLLTDVPNPNDNDTIIEHLQNTIRKHNELRLRNYEIGISLGVASYTSDTTCSISKLLDRADEMMYQNKKRTR